MKRFKPKPFPWSLLWPSFPPLSAESPRQDEFRPDVCSSHQAFGYVTITQSLGAVPAGVHCPASSLRKSPEWNWWRIQWFTGMVEGCFCTHLSAAWASLEINTQGWSMGMIQGSPTDSQKLKKKSEIKHQSQTATILWNSRAVVGNQGMPVWGTAPDLPGRACYVLQQSTDRHKEGICTICTDKRSCWLCSVEGITSATDCRHCQGQPTTTSSYLSPSKRKKDTQHPRKPICIKQVALSMVEQEWVCGTGDTSHKPGTRPQITQQWCSQDGRGAGGYQKEIHMPSLQTGLSVGYYVPTPHSVTCLPLSVVSYTLPALCILDT